MPGRINIPLCGKRHQLHGHSVGKCFARGQHPLEMGETRLCVDVHVAADVGRARGKGRFELARRLNRC